MEEFLYVEKYRPKTVSDTILPEKLKSVFQKFVEQKNVPNLILSGRAGVGKTTIARAMLEEIGCDYIIINGSLNAQIDRLRTDIANFASTTSFVGGRKYVIIDEADYMSATHTQPALRNFIEEFSANCGFIMTCNFKNRIIEPLHSRCSVIDFSIPKEEIPKLAACFWKRTCHILDKEGVQYDPKVVAEFINSHFPDWRRCLNELQRYSSMGKIDSSILAAKSNDNIDVLVGYLKNKNFTDMRKWVSDNSDVDSTELYRKLYDILPTKIKSTSSVSDAIIILAEYQFKEAFVANSVINRVACLSILMAEVDWK
jgi:DNA polymerase III delta prime subunit